MHGTGRCDTGHPSRGHSITPARDGYARDGRRASARHHSYGVIELPAILKDTDPYRFVVSSTVRVP